jgi:hypothetical protein
VIGLLKLSGSLSAKKQNKFVSLIDLVTPYKSSKFLILCSSSDEDVDDSDDDNHSVGVFLLLNTGNPYAEVYGSFAGTIGPFVSTVGSSISSSRTRLI